jgi:DNA-binding Lrp family transcriptional regulator
MKATDRALAAMRANPRKSNRAIADEIGVSKDTVRRAREATGDQSLIDKPRVGQDGKICGKDPTQQVHRKPP